MSVEFMIQSGNPRFRKIVDPDDASIFDAAQTIFLSNTERAFMIWHQVHIPLGYKYVLSFLLADVLAMLDRLMSQESGTLEIHWPSNEFSAKWDMTWGGSNLEVRSEWEVVGGCVTKLLSERPLLRIEKHAFIREWEHLLGVVLSALTRAGYGDDQLADLTTLRSVHAAIGELGDLYSVDASAEPTETVFRNP